MIERARQRGLQLSGENEEQPSEKERLKQIEIIRSLPVNLQVKRILRCVIDPIRFVFVRRLYTDWEGCLLIFALSPLLNQIQSPKGGHILVLVQFTLLL